MGGRSKLYSRPHVCLFVFNLELPNNCVGDQALSDPYMWHFWGQLELEYHDLLSLFEFLDNGILADEIPRILLESCSISKWGPGFSWLYLMITTIYNLHFAKTKAEIEKLTITYFPSSIKQKRHHDSFSEKKRTLKFKVQGPLLLLKRACFFVNPKLLWKGGFANARWWRDHLDSPWDWWVFFTKKSTKTWRDWHSSWVDIWNSTKFLLINVGLNRWNAALTTGFCLSKVAVQKTTSSLRVFHQQTREFTNI